MPSRTKFATKGNNSRVTTSGQNKRGRDGAETFHVGKYKPGSQFFLHRANLLFNLDAAFWDNVELVTDARLEFTLTQDNANGRARTRLRNKGWVDDGGTTWDTDDWVASSVTDTAQRWLQPTTGRVSLDIMSMVHQLAPGNVRVQGKGSGRNRTNKGIQLGETGKATASEAIHFLSNNTATEADRPAIVITYEPVNDPPVAALVSPSGNVDSDFTISGTWTDTNVADILAAVGAQVRDSEGNVIWDRTYTEWTGDWDVGGLHISLLKLGDYDVRVRVKDSGAAWSDWTSWDPFSITALVPAITANPVGQQVSMAGVLFTADFILDPTAEPATKVDIQVQDQGGSWDTSSMVWSDSYVPSKSEQDGSKVSTLYRGANLPAGFYEWRVRVTDILGGLSPWSNTDTVELLVGVPDDDADLDFTTGWSNLQVQQRIVLYGMQEANRGPTSQVKAIIENPSQMGVMWNATAPGGLWFTLPTDHPQVSEIEPWITHYRVQQYRRGAWKTLQYGVIRDFDAKDDEVVFLGTDYLGLLAFNYESAMQPEENPRKNIGVGVGALQGSRYFNKTIKYIVKDQLKRARLQEDYSPVRFIQIGRVDKMDEKITIYAHFRQRLNFIRGLIDSHRGAAGAQGERRSRLRVHYNTTEKKHQFQLLDNVGKDRPNIRLEYGSLLQNYQVIPMGDFVTRVHGWGREPNASRPHFKHVTAPGIDTKDWGSISTAVEYVDVIDKKDLQRRTKQAAIVGSRIGKSIALALRVDGLDPFDGWTLLDSFPVHIQDGVVDTERYGSGYWTVWKAEWYVYPDGHDELRLTMRPKGDQSTIEPDLIPSDPIHFKTDWKWGHGSPPGYTP